MEQVSRSEQVEPSMLFFIIHSMQIGIGIFGFQRFIAQSAGYDSWISVLIALAISHLILFIIFKIIEMRKGDLMDIHKYAFGNFVGKFLSSVFSIYVLFVCALTLRRYTEVVQVWIFKEISTFSITLALLLIAFYGVICGFRTIVGIGFFSVILPAYLLIIFSFVIPYTDFSDFLPIVSHSFSNIFYAAGVISMSYLGYEFLLVYSPFIENIKKAKKWGHLSLFITGMIYLYLTILSFGYYSEKQLELIIWPTLSMWKIIKFSFLWRFEYIGISMWSLVILPNVCISIWTVSRIWKRVYSASEIGSLILIGVILLFLTTKTDTRHQIDILAKWVNIFGFIFTHFYIPFLFFLLSFLQKVRKKHEI